MDPNPRNVPAGSPNTYSAGAKVMIGTLGVEGEIVSCVPQSPANPSGASTCQVKHKDAAGNYVTGSFPTSDLSPA